MLKLATLVAGAMIALAVYAVAPARADEPKCKSIDFILGKAAEQGAKPVILHGKQAQDAIAFYNAAPPVSNIVGDVALWHEFPSGNAVLMIGRGTEVCFLSRMAKTYAEKFKAAVLGEPL